MHRMNEHRGRFWLGATALCWVGLVTAVMADRPESGERSEESTTSSLESTELDQTDRPGTAAKPPTRAKKSETDLVPDNFEECRATGAETRRVGNTRICDYRLERREAAQEKWEACTEKYGTNRPTDEHGREQPFMCANARVACPKEFEKEVDDPLSERLPDAAPARVVRLVEVLRRDDVWPRDRLLEYVDRLELLDGALADELLVDDADRRRRALELAEFWARTGSVPDAVRSALVQLARGEAGTDSEALRSRAILALRELGDDGSGRPDAASLELPGDTLDDRLPDDPVDQFDRALQLVRKDNEWSRPRVMAYAARNSELREVLDHELKGPDGEPRPSALEFAETWAHERALPLGVLRELEEIARVWGTSYSDSARDAAIRALAEARNFQDVRLDEEQRKAIGIYDP